MNDQNKTSKLPLKKRKHFQENVAPQATKRALDCFVISPIKRKYCVYTCRKCYRTFTKESWAMTHSCLGEESGRTERSPGIGKEPLPPLKIRLFSINSGLFVCYLCRTSFKEKTDLVEHIKEHFVKEDWEEEEGTRLRKEKGKKRERHDSEDERRADRKKRKKKKSQDGTVGTDRTCGSDGFSRTPSPRTKETRERSTQYPETEDSAPEVESVDDGRSKADEHSDEPAMIPLEDDDEVTVLKIIQHKTPTTVSICGFCDKIFTTKNALVTHVEKHLVDFAGDSPPENFLCSVCPTTFTSEESLLEHERSHEAENAEDGIISISLGEDFSWGRRSRGATF